jgi:hypothetical protein
MDHAESNQVDSVELPPASSEGAIFQEDQGFDVDFRAGRSIHQHGVWHKVG